MLHAVVLHHHHHASLLLRLRDDEHMPSHSPSPSQRPDCHGFDCEYS
jgi:hypothetical protein